MCGPNLIPSISFAERIFSAKLIKRWIFQNCLPMDLFYKMFGKKAAKPDMPSRKFCDF